MENDNGRIYYGTGIDNSQLRTDAEESKRILSGITGTAVNEGKRIDDVFKSIGKTAAGVFAVSQMKDFAMQVVEARNRLSDDDRECRRSERPYVATHKNCRHNTFRSV